MLIAIGMLIGAPIGALVMSWCTAAATADHERERMKRAADANLAVRAQRVEANIDTHAEESLVL